MSSTLCNQCARARGHPIGDGAGHVRATDYPDGSFDTLLSENPGALTDEREYLCADCGGTAVDFFCNCLGGASCSAGHAAPAPPEGGG